MGDENKGAAASQPPARPRKREAVVEVSERKPEPPRQSRVRVKLLSALRTADGLFPAGHEGEFPDSVIRDPALAHVFGEATPQPVPVLPDTADGGSPGFEPPLMPANKSGF